MSFRNQKQVEQARIRLIQESQPFPTMLKAFNKGGMREAQTLLLQIKRIIPKAAGQWEMAFRDASRVR